jgi:prepilin-type N-terminal cleavage/methylation domain-containing protein
MTRINHNIRSGFTLIEMLVVVAIIAVLLALLFPAVNKARERARRVKAAGEVRELEKVWNMYFRTFEDLPAGNFMDATHCAILDGNNPDQRQFMEFTERQLTEGMKDPWGQLYQLNFNPNAQEVITKWYYATRVYPANAGR